MFVQDALEAGLDVAADELGAEVRTELEELGGSSGAGCADDGVGGEVVKRFGGETDEAVSDVASLGHGGEGEPWRVVGGEVFEAVDGDVCFLVEQGAFDGSGEEPFAAFVVERDVGELIAFGLEPDVADLDMGVEFAQRSADRLGLGFG